MTSVGILADCDCATSSFNPVVPFGAMPLPPLSVVLTVNMYDGVGVTTTFTSMDTVSFTCGFTGYDLCGSRTITFVDLATALPVDFSTPHPFLSFDPVTGVLTAVSSKPADAGIHSYNVNYQLD